jgi:hypothetical protein
MRYMLLSALLIVRAMHIMSLIQGIRQASCGQASILDHSDPSRQVGVGKCSKPDQRSYQLPASETMVE